MIVLDASALIEVLLRSGRAHAIERRIFATGETLHVPHLIDIEVAHVLRRFWLLGDLDEERGRAALSDLADFPLARYPHSVLLARMWALRRQLTGYDAAYVALAEALDATLLTCDAKLAGSKGHAARILVA